jgi:DNA-binding transcriptional MocR family regulator
MTTGASGAGKLDKQRKKVPLYVQLAQLLRQRIYGGEWGVGDSLPSETTLRADWDVSLETIRSALGILREEGLIVTEHGAGTKVKYVPGRVTVEGAPGDRMESRMPTPAERRKLDIPEGVPLVVLVHPDGREDCYDSLRTSVVIPG